MSIRPIPCVGGTIVTLFASLLGVGMAMANSVIPHADGSFEAPEAPHDEVAAGLARSFVDQTTAATIQEVPEHLTGPLEVLAEIEDLRAHYHNGFLNISFQTTYRFRLDAPLEIGSLGDFEAVMPIVDLAEHDGEWTVRFYQSPQTGRWHILSADVPTGDGTTTHDPLWIENVSRHTFRVRTRDEEAPVLGELIFNQYMPVFDQAIDLQRRIPVIVGEHSHEYSLRQLTGAPGEEGLYRLTITADPGEWDTADFSWACTPADFALAAAMAVPGEYEWHFPLVRIDRHTWRMSAAPWIAFSDTGVEIASIEESEAQFAARMEAAELRKQLELAERLLEQQRWEDLLEQDAAARRLWIAQTDGIQMARLVLANRDQGREIGGPLIEASLSTYPFRPWMLNRPDVDWLNSPIHDLRETGQVGSLRRFEFTVEALPTREMLPMELWASFSLDRITVERIEISSRPLEAAKPELGTPLPLVEPQTLYTSAKGEKTALVLQEMSRPRADAQVLERIGQGLLYRRSPDRGGEVRGPVPGQAPNTRPTAPQRRTGPAAGGCASGRCG